MSSSPPSGVFASRSTPDPAARAPTGSRAERSPTAPRTPRRWRTPSAPNPSHPPAPCAAFLEEGVTAAGTIAGAALFEAEGLDWIEGMGEENHEEIGAAQRGPAH